MSRYDGLEVTCYEDCSECKYQLNEGYCYWGVAIKKLAGAPSQLLCRKKHKLSPPRTSSVILPEVIPIRTDGRRTHMLHSRWVVIMDITAPNGDKCSIHGPEDLNRDCIPGLASKALAAKLFVKQHL